MVARSWPVGLCDLLEGDSVSEVSELTDEVVSAFVGSTVAFVGRLNDGWSPNPGDTPTPVVEGSGCRLVNQHLRREQRKRLTMSISGLEPIRQNSSSVHRSVKAGRRPPRRGLALRDREVIGATLADQARQGLMGAAGLGERPRDAGGPTKGAEDPPKASIPDTKCSYFSPRSRVYDSASSWL